jgi:hypothetical protein
LHAGDICVAEHPKPVSAGTARRSNRASAPHQHRPACGVGPRRDIDVPAIEINLTS